MDRSYQLTVSAGREVRQRRAEAQRMRERRDLTRAYLKRSRRVLARGARLLAVSAAHGRAPADDPGSRAAALGPSLARAVMALGPRR